MTIERIIPDSEAHWLSLRTLDITSTEIAALFGISPYMTKFELWHRKKEAAVVRFEANERMKWGTRLQDAIAAGIAADNGWVIRPMKEYIRDTERRIGSSFDFAVVNCDEAGREYDSALLEIKNVDALMFRDGWVVGDDGNVEAPPHIELQVQHQLLLAGLDRASIGALVGGNSVTLIPRERDESVTQAILGRAEEFWQSIAANSPPDPDFARDAGFIARLYQHAEPGKIIDGSGNMELASLAEQYRAFGEAEKRAGEQKQGLKAQILMMIGDAEKVVGDTFSSITAGVIGPAEVSYTRDGYRNFRINWRKEKKQ